MKLPGLTRMVSILGGFVLAVPMAIIGFEFLGQGRTGFGFAFLGLSIALLFLPEFVLSRLPKPRQVLRERVGRLRRD